MAEFGRPLGKGRIRASIEKLSRRVTENGRICVSIEKMAEFVRVPGKGTIRARIENFPGVYRKRVESV